jgi:hypothetical protein
MKKCKKEKKQERKNTETKCKKEKTQREQEKGKES